MGKNSSNISSPNRWTLSAWCLIENAFSSRPDPSGTSAQKALNKMAPALLCWIYKLTNSEEHLTISLTNKLTRHISDALLTPNISASKKTVDTTTTGLSSAITTIHQRKMTRLSTFTAQKTISGLTNISLSKPTITLWWPGLKPDMTTNGSLKPMIWEMMPMEN